MLYYRHMLDKIPPSPPEAIRLRQAAVMFGVDGTTAIRWVKQGIFKTARKLNPALSNSPYIIDLAEVEAFLEAREPKREKE